MKYGTKRQNAIIRNYTNGKSQGEIARKFNMPVGSVRYILFKNNVEKKQYKPKIINNMSVVQLSYIAGILDGEGCISINKRPDRDYKHGYSFIAAIRVNNTYKELIYWLRDTIGLGTIVSRKADKKTNRQAIYELKIHTQQAQQLLDVITNFLIVKKKQAKIMTEFNRIKGDNIYRNGPLPDNVWKKMNSLYNEIKRLNKRGVQ